MPTGSVMSGTRDMPIAPRRVAGVRRVAEGLIRRLSTPRTTCPSDPNYGINIADSLQDTPDEAALSRLRGAIKNECEKDPDVETATVPIFAYSIVTKTLSIRIVCFGPDGTSFFLTAEATAAGVVLLEAA